jgi:hypothetical protein
VDLDSAAGDADFLDDESQQLSSALDVEVAERNGDLLGETGQAAS